MVTERIRENQLVLMFATQSVAAEPRNRARILTRSAVIALSYLLIAWVFHTATINPFHNLIGGGDGLIFGFPSKIFATTFSSWNPYVQTGEFVYADILSQCFYPPSLLILSIFRNTFGFNLFIVVHYALAGLFTYLYLGSLRLTAYSAWIGGLIFMLCGFMTAHKGHEYMICVAVWLPLTLYFLKRYAERLRIIDLGYAGVAVGLSVLAGFPQLTLYSTVLVLAYLSFCIVGSPLLRGWKTKLAHIGFAAAVVVGMGCLLGCLPVLCVAETLPYLTRERLTYDMFIADNFTPWQLFTVFIPNLFGEVNRQVSSYVLSTRVSGLDAYLGQLPLALALIGLLAWRKVGRELRFWTAAATTALLLSFGDIIPLYRLLFYVPVYNLFRAPGRHLFELSFALAVIAAIGLDFLVRQFPSGHQYFARTVRRSIVGISLLFGSAVAAAMTLRSMAEGSFSNDVSVLDSAKPIILRNLSWTSTTMTIPLLFFALTVGILVMLIRTRRRVTTMIAIPILIVADLFLASYLIYDNPSTKRLSRHAKRPELAVLKVRRFDSKHYRVFPVDYQLTWSYPLLNVFSQLPVINDYTPFWPKRYQTVTGFRADGNMPAVNLQNYKLLSLLGTRYLMVLLPETRHLIEETILDLAESNEMVLIGPDVDSWRVDGASKAADAAFTLQKADNANYSLIQTDVPLKPNSNYEVSFVASGDTDLRGTPLYIDLYAMPSYVSAETTRLLTALSKEPCRYSVVINSGPAAPARATARLYTQSASPIRLRDLHVKELEGSPLKAFSAVAETTNGVTIFENANALPRFRFVRRVIPARAVDDAMCLMRQPDFDPANQAVVEGIDGAEDLAPGRFLSERIENTQLQWEVETSGRSFLVVADSYCPGWTATVDGRPASIHPVYGCVRGIFIETAGRHHIEMRFVPRTLYAGIGCTGLGFLALGILWYGDRTGRLRRFPIR
jgi:hypothetical protein